MKIIQGLDAPKPFGGPPAGAAAPAPDLGRLDALELIAKNILQKLQALEERVEIIEAPRPAAAHVVEKTPAAPSAPLELSTATLDTDAVRKGLLTQMWKYLNDERPPKAA